MYTLSTLTDLREFSNREKLFILGELIKEWIIPILIVGIGISLIIFIFWYWWTRYTEHTFMVQSGLEMAAMPCLRKNTNSVSNKKQTVLVPRKIVARELAPDGRVITPDIPFLKIN